MHQIRRIITVVQLHVFRRVLLDVRGIVSVLEVFVQLLGFQLVLKLPNYIILTRKSDNSRCRKLGKTQRIE